MAFVNGLSGDLSATGSTDLSFLIESGVRPYQASIAVNREVLEGTGFGSTAPVAMDKIAGVKDWSGSFNARFPQTTPASGHEGLVTFANGYVLGCHSWSITASASEHEETGFSSTPPEWRDYSSGLYQFSGNWLVQVDDTTALAGLTDAAGTGAASFRLNKETTNNNLFSASNIIVSGRSAPFEVNGKPVVQYDFTVDGMLQVDGDNPMFEVAVAGVPDDLVRPAATAITLRAAGSRTYTGSAFATGWTVGASIGSPITTTVNFRGTGALTDN